MNQDTDITAYAKRLYERRTEGIMLKWADASIGEWKPEPKMCHDNVTTFCENNPSFRPIRGWLYIDFLGMIGYVNFIAHSAINSPDGELYDITPSNATQQYPFILAEESEAEYAALVEGRGIAKLVHQYD